LKRLWQKKFGKKEASSIGGGIRRRSDVGKRGRGWGVEMGNEKNWEGEEGRKSVLGKGSAGGGGVKAEKKEETPPKHRRQAGEEDEGDSKKEGGPA